jgi:hypothetical protein
VLGALDRAFEDKRWQEVIDLGRAIDPYVALRGQWDVWGRVIDWVGEASAELGASADLAWSLHQAGSRALMLGHAAAAEKALLAALSIREQSGDVVGAAYTRHNLNRLRGGPPPGERTPQPKPDGRHRPWARALWIATVAVVIVGSSVVGAFGLGIIGASDRTSPPQPTEAPIPTPTETPTPLVAAIAVPPGIEFGSVEVPGTATQDMIIVNSGTLPIAVRALDPGGNQPNEFAVAPGTCLSRLIQPNDSCRASITFRPARAGLRDADLVVSTDQLAPTTVHLAGFGVETGELKLDPPAMQFDAISSEPLPQTATIVATGPLTVVGLPVEGSYASEFSVVQDDCVDVHLMARQGCRIMVQYTPPSESWVDLAPDRDATLVIRTASGTAWTITLLAHLTVPVLTASGTLVFGVAIGSTSITVTVTSSCGFQVTGGVNGQLIWGNVADNVTIYEVSQYAAGQQTLQVSALTLPHDFGESASQTIADCQ